MVQTVLNAELDERSQTIFRLIVDGYLEDGEPTGSRTLARQLENSLSAATIRNVMSDLEHLGLIYSPHVSAGRMPTQAGLRFFVDTLMEVSPLDGETRGALDEFGGTDRSTAVLSRASALLGSMAKGAGLVLTSKSDAPLRHIEFIRLDADRALVILVKGNGTVENRVFDLPAGIAASQLVEAANFLNANLAGRTLDEARSDIAALKTRIAREVDELSSELVERGLAVWAQPDGFADGSAQLIVRGRGNLLENAPESEDVERLRVLFEDLETKDGIVRLLDLAEDGEGVRIFIGSENKLFSLSGSSLVVAPYRDREQQIVGAVGVIGPTRLNYGRIVSVVDYTARLFSRAASGG